jgi:tRNA(His) 5'-end guanylyltransferase
MKSDALGDRMKAYENISRTYLTRRIPVIIRLDGKAFHTFTRGLEKPFDKILMSVMQQTMKRLCEEVQGCVFGYTQSDEITLVLTDYATIQTDAWFGYNIQKMTSVAASIATVEFNRILAEELSGAIEEYNEEWHSPPGRWEYLMQYEEKLFKATFDARCFSIPKEEVCNCLIWRQQDATRNSIEAVGQAHFGHTQLHGKSCNMIQEMLWSEHNINWNDFPTDCKRGAACYRVKRTVEMDNPRNPCETITVQRKQWEIDREIPVFTQDRNFIERFL